MKVSYDECMGVAATGKQDRVAAANEPMIMDTTYYVYKIFFGVYMNGF